MITTQPPDVGIVVGENPGGLYDEAAPGMATSTSNSMLMVAPVNHFHSMNRQLWEFRANSVYTDVILVCKDGSIPAHASVLVKLFSHCNIDLVSGSEDEVQPVLLPSCSLDQVEAALLQTYACGSIQAFCHLLSLNENTLSSHTITHTRPDFIESAEPQDITHIHFDIKPDLNEENELLDALKDLEEENIASRLTQSKTFRTRKNLSEKVDTEDPKPFKCDKCKYSAVSESKLDIHNKSKHLGITKYNCDHCSFKSNKQHDMKMHMREVHSLGTEGKRCQHRCVHCNQFEASNKKLLDLHIIEVHKNVRKYHCDQCNYMTNYHINFQRHQKAHLGIPGSYLCPYCPKSFYVEAKLRSHMLVHTSEKNFVCEECAAKFKRKDDLKVHMKVHLPEHVRAVEKARKLTKVCETCGKKFEKNWKLKRHMIVHNKEPLPLDKVAQSHRWQSNKGMPLQEYIVLTSDAKYLESADKLITPDRVVVSEAKLIDPAADAKFLGADGKCVATDRIVFNQIQYTDA